MDSLPSTSKAVKKGNSQHETAVKEETQSLRMRSASDVNLHETVVSGRIAPARDGTFVRIRRVFLRYGVPVAVGSAVGVGAFQLSSSLNRQAIANLTEELTDPVILG